MINLISDISGRYITSKNVSILSLLLLVIFSGCATIIKPQELRDAGVDKDIALSQVVKNPETYKGKIVLWGGKIMKAVNKKEGTLIEVLHLPLDRSDRPKDIDISEGRFLVLYPGYLDAAIYRPGREITLVGEIQGLKKLPLGEIEYTYPLLKPRKIHLWEIRPEEIKVFHEYPPYLYWYPYRWGYPYCW